MLAMQAAGPCWAAEREPMRPEEIRKEAGLQSLSLRRDPTRRPEAALRLLSAERKVADCISGSIVLQAHKVCVPIRHTIPRSRRGRTLSSPKLPCGRGLCRLATQQMFGPFGGDNRQSEVGRNVPTQFPVSLCLRPGPHVAHRTERHPGRADHKESSDPKSKRLRPASAGELSCPRSECPLAATAPVHSCTVPRRHGRITHRQEDVPWGRCVFVFVFFFFALSRRRRGNVALITTPPVPDCLNAVEHLQPRCLEVRLFPQQNKEKQAPLKRVRISTKFPNTELRCYPPLSHGSMMSSRERGL